MSAKGSARRAVASPPPAVDELSLLRARVAALEQLLDVYEQAVVEQSGKLEKASADLALRVIELAGSNAKLTKLNQHLQHEIGEREQAEESLRRSERLASIGTLAAGLAHEINNPLGMIVLEIERARRSADDAAELASSLTRIDGFVDRCARIVKSVLQFAREEATETWEERIGDVADRVRDFTRDHAARSGVELAFACAEDLPPLVINPVQMEQVLINLVVNAVHACPDGGHVCVRAERVDGAVQISVTDDGHGMSAQEREKAFDPFYTTRFGRGGTGLGLSTCHGIVTGLGGTIEIDSDPAVGTTVTIRLPVGGE